MGKCWKVLGHCEGQSQCQGNDGRHWTLSLWQGNAWWWHGDIYGDARKMVSNVEKIGRDIGEMVGDN
jgi:hypothetical protein